MKRKPSGFTVVELMIVVLIIMIICAIAIPSYMNAVQRAHEAVAVSFLRQVQTSQEAYRISSQQYADKFSKLQPYMSAELIRPPLPVPGVTDGLVSIAYAEPAPGGSSQGQSGSSPGQSGSTPGQSGSTPGQSGSAPGQSGSAPGQSGSTPGQSGSTPGQSGSTPGQSGSTPGQGGSAGSTGSTAGQGSGGSSTAGGASTGTGTQAPDSIVYSKYIFALSLADAEHWNCTGEPVGNRLNSKFYYTDQSSVIHYAIGAVADSASADLQ